MTDEGEDGSYILAAARAGQLTAGTGAGEGGGGAADACGQ